MKYKHENNKFVILNAMDYCNTVINNNSKYANTCWEVYEFGN